MKYQKVIFLIPLQRNASYAHPLAPNVVVRAQYFSNLDTTVNHLEDEAHIIKKSVLSDCLAPSSVAEERTHSTS